MENRRREWRLTPKIKSSGSFEVTLKSTKCGNKCLCKSNLVSPISGICVICTDFTYSATYSNSDRKYFVHYRQIPKMISRCRFRVILKSTQIDQKCLGIQALIYIQYFCALYHMYRFHLFGDLQSNLIENISFIEILA